MAIGPKTVNQKAGKSVFNTSMSFSWVLQRKMRLVKAKRSSDISIPDSSNPWRNPEKDMMKLGKVYDNPLIDTIQSKFEKAIQEDDNVRKITHDGEVYARQLCSWGWEDRGVPKFDFAEHIPELGEIVNDEITELLNQYYEAHFKPDFAKIYRNYHIPPEVVEETEIYSNYWHCDSYAADGIKLFVNLNDVTEDHGPFHIISREDTKRLVGSGYNRKDQGVPGKEVEIKADIIKATGEAGTSMLANTNLCLHRADNPSEGNQRDLIMINFLVSDKPFSDDWLNDYPLERDLGTATK